MDEKEKLIKNIAEEYFKIKSTRGITLGGSQARGFSDDNSDIEMYIYYEKEIPSKKEIKDILKKLNASLIRSKKLHWKSEVWGTHTFFKVNGVKVELGYRDYQEFESKLKDFLSNLNFLPKYSIHHDVPFGHYPSGRASCVLESKIIKQKDEKISKLKNLTKHFPDKLREKMIKYYISDMDIITHKKLKEALIRNDSYQFNAILSYILRSIIMLLFIINKKYYPGDKWNERYIKEFKIKPVKFEEKVSEIFFKDIKTKEEKKNIVKRLEKLEKEIIKLIK